MTSGKKKHFVKPPKLTIEDVRAFLAREGCVLLSKEYHGTYHFIEYICQCGHRHKIVFYAFKRGQGRRCPSCVGNTKKTIEQVRDIFAKEGCKLLSTTYKWNRDKMKYIARCGHEHTIKASAFFEGEGRLCPSCQREVNARKNPYMTSEEQKWLFMAEGCELISPARRMEDKVRYIAKCGHVNEIGLHFFVEGWGRMCKKCSNRASIGEKVTNSVLQCLGVEYNAQHYIKFKGRNFGRFDFFIPSKKIAIEFNGIQHYEDVKFNNSNVCNIDEQRKRDERKRDYCKEHGITMIEIDGRKWSQIKMLDGTMFREIKKLLKKEIFR